MITPSYRDILSHSWRLIIQHKISWILGVLSLVVGQFGLLNFVGKLWVLHADRLEPHETALASIIRLAGSLHGGNWIPALAIFAILIALAIAAAIIAVIAQATLIAAAAEWYRKKKYIKLARLWHDSVVHFWPIFSVHIIEKIILSIIVLITYQGIYLSLLLPQGARFAASLFLFVGLFIAFTVATVTIFAMNYVVIEYRSVIEAIRLGWFLFSRYLLTAFEFNLTSFALIIILILSFLLLFPYFLLPSIFFLHLVGSSAHIIQYIQVSFTFTVLAVTMVLIFLSGVFNAFITSAWVYLFMCATHKGIISRTWHFISRRLLRHKI